MESREKVESGEKVLGNGLGVEQKAAGSTCSLASPNHHASRHSAASSQWRTSSILGLSSSDDPPLSPDPNLGAPLSRGELPVSCTSLGFNQPSGGSSPKAAIRVALLSA